MKSRRIELEVVGGSWGEIVEERSENNLVSCQTTYDDENNTTAGASASPGVF